MWSPLKLQRMGRVNFGFAEQHETDMVLRWSGAGAGLLAGITIR